MKQMVDTFLDRGFTYYRNDMQYLHVIFKDIIPNCATDIFSHFRHLF